MKRRPTKTEWTTSRCPDCGREITHAKDLAVPIVACDDCRLLFNVETGKVLLRREGK
jgi:hypothetical protein